MTVGEAIKKLKQFDKNLPLIFVNSETEFSHNEVTEIKEEEVKYCEEPNGRTLAKEQAVVLRDE